MKDIKNQIRKSRRKYLLVKYDLLKVHEADVNDMLEWAFKKDNKVRIKFIEQELERVKSNIEEISKSQRVDLN